LARLENRQIVGLGPHFQIPGLNGVEFAFWVGLGPGHFFVVRTLENNLFGGKTFGNLGLDWEGFLFGRIVSYQQGDKKRGVF